MFRTLTHLFNPLAMLLAGTRLMPLYGVINHRGRKSGKPFKTPVVVRPTPDGFVVPMPWGESTDWFRNIRAAGGCQIRWKGRDYQLVQPEVVDSAAAGDAFGSFERGGLARFGITKCLQLHFADARTPATAS
jgi:deazaflavin-dependent oxidoreductase (nitroreductase family)